jgi:putative hydrolase of the HAD superfamily
MPRRPHAVLFDMDNTLYNFVDAKIAACTRVVELFGLSDGMPLFRYFLRNVHGFEHHDNIRDYLADLSLGDEDQIDEACRIYEAVKLEEIRPYPALHETLELIRDAGIAMGVVTDAESFQAKKRLAKIGIDHFFQCVVCPDHSGRRKPEHDSFLLALSLLSVRPEEAWLVGDSLRREVLPGQEIGMITVHAKYGDWIGAPSHSIIPDYVLQEFAELPDLLGLR